MATTSAPTRTNRSLTIVIALALVVVLVVVVVLPPISLLDKLSSRGMQSISANSNSDVKDPDGTQVSFPAIPYPGNPDITTVPGDFRAGLNSVPLEYFVRGDAGEDLAAAAEELAIPDRLIPKSPFYQLQIKGTEPMASVLTVPTPNESEPYETVDLYEWTGSEWRFVPSHVVFMDNSNEYRILSELNYVPTSFMVMQNNPLTYRPASAADLPVAQPLPDAGRDALVEVNPSGYFLAGDGTISGSVSIASDASASYAVVPTLRNWGDDGVVRTDLLDNLLISPDIQETHLSAIEALVVGNNYPGIEIDYRGLDPTMSSEFTNFVQTVAERLHGQQKNVVVRVEEPQQIADDRWSTGGYDWRALGAAADTVRVPAPLAPQAYAPAGQFDSLLEWATSEIPRDKVEVVLPARSVEQAGGYLLPLSYSEALAPLLGEGQSSQPVLVPGESVDFSLLNERVIGTLNYDPNVGMFTYDYRDNAGYVRTVWIENAASLGDKLKRIAEYQVKGAVLQHMLDSDWDPDIWSVVREFLAGESPNREVSYNVVWTVTDPAGQVTSEQRPLDAASFSYTPPNSEGQVQVSASIANSGRMVAGGPTFALELATATPAAPPTPTPEPTPEATPTPEPTPTPDFASIVANQTVNLRGGPGTAYSVVGQVNGGVSLPILGKNSDSSWWQVEQSNREPAWVIARLVTAQGPTDQVAVAEDIPEPPPQQVAAAPAQSSGGGGSASPAPAPSAASTGFFGYGIQAHMVDNGQAPQVMNVTKNMGFNWVKQQVEWKRFEASPGQYAWDALDPIVNAAGGAGVSLLASVVNAPSWARGGGADLSVGGPPEDPGTFARFLGALAGKYCGSALKAIEVWNEQNLHYEWGNQPIDPAAYMNLLKPSYNAIKQACPSMIVVSGALTPTGAPAPWAMDDIAYLDGMYQNGLKNYSDAIGAHPSGYNVPPDVRHEEACGVIQETGNTFNGPCENPHHSWSFRSTMEGYRNIMVRYGDSAKRIWPTEFGWAAGGAFDDRYRYADDNDFQEQAEWTVRSYQMMKNWGFVGVAFLWNLNFRVVANGTEKAQWGIVDPGWGPLPAYSALQAMPK